MSTMVCLISDQLIPNILGIHHFRPKKLVLVETRGMRKKNVVENLMAALLLRGLDYSHSTERLLLQEEDSLPAMKICLTPLLGGKKSLPGGSWLVNLTGGTKPMSLGTYAFFKEHAPSEGESPIFLYMNAGKPEDFMLLDRGEKIRCSHNLSIEEFLRAYGFSICPNPVEAEKDILVKNLWECSRKIAADLCLGSIFSDHVNNEKIGKLRRSEGVLEKEFIRQELQQAIFPCFQGNNALNNQEWGFLLGEWMEVFFAGLLERHSQNLGISDVRLGVQIQSIATETLTEFDVAFMKNHALHVMECKCGSVKGMRPEAHMDRLAARTKQMGALRVTPYFATNSPLLQDEKGLARDAVKKRAELYGIRLLMLREIRKLGTDADTPETVTSLFKLPR